MCFGVTQIRILMGSREIVVEEYASLWLVSVKYSHSFCRHYTIVLLIIIFLYVDRFLEIMLRGMTHAIGGE